MGLPLTLVGTLWKGIGVQDPGGSHQSLEASGALQARNMATVSTSPGQRERENHEAAGF